MKTGCQISLQAQSLAHSSLALPLRILQGRLMAPIQFDSISMLVEKLLVGHTRSISGQILRGKDFRLTASFILYEMICYWGRSKFCVFHLVVYQYYSPCPSMWGPHIANPLLTAPKKAVNKQWHCAQYLYITHEWICLQTDKGTTRILTIVQLRKIPK